MKIGIVGSREFPQLELVKMLVGEFPKGVTVVSGGAAGVDRTAADAARAAGLEVLEFLPDLNGCKARHEFTARYYARNQQIIEASDLLIAFTEKDSGGTWDTIKRARLAKKPVKVMRPVKMKEEAPAPARRESNPNEGATIDFIDNPPPAAAAEAPPAQEAPAKEKRAAGREKGVGPFHLKRVGLGSFALKLRRYIDPVDWADFINAKDHDPGKAAAAMVPAFLEFFQEHNFGVIHAITQAPKSVRRGDALHPMDLVCRAVADALEIPYVVLFEPWDKRRRGRHAAHPDITVKPEVREWVGKVVFVLDDVSTTNNTLKASVGALNSMEIHTHGLAYVLYA